MSRAMERFYGIVERVESGGDPNAVSPKGARGPMQLMPGTIRDPGFGVKPPRDNSPQENRRAGQDYLEAMHQRYGDVNTALMAYNWGPGSVDKWIKGGRNPNKVPKETRDYVAKITGGQITGGNMPRGNEAQAQVPPPILQMGAEEPVEMPVLAENPNRPAEIQTRPVLTQEMMQGALNPQTAAAEDSPALKQLRALEGQVDQNVRARQEALLGADAANFARENNLALNDKRVLDFAADRNVSPLQKGLSILQGIIGTPFGILGNALGENIDYTSAFRPEQTYKTRAQRAIAALDTAGIEAKSEIAGMRQDARQSIFTAIQPAVKSAYDAVDANRLEVGQNIENKMIRDALINAGYQDKVTGEIDTSSPAAQQFIQQLTMAMQPPKRSSPLETAVAALLGDKFVDKRDETLGKADAEYMSGVLNEADKAAKQIGTAEALYSASERLGDVSYGGAVGSVKSEIQSSLAALGINSENFTDKQILDAQITGQALPRMQMLGGNDSERELILVQNGLGGSASPLEARRMANLSNIASLKAQVDYGATFRQYVQRVGRESANQIDFMESREYKEFQRKKLFQFEPRILPSLFRLDPKRYGNFALKNGVVYVRGVSRDGKAVPINTLSQDQIDKAMGN